MIKLLQNFIALLFITSCFSQTTTIQLDRTYGSNSFDDTRNVVESNGGYIAFGHSTGYSNDNSSNFYLVKTDAAGNELWSKNFDSDNAQSVYYAGNIVNPIPVTPKSNQLGYAGDQMQLTTDGGIIMAGTSAYSIVTAHPQEFRGFPYVVKTDMNGNVLWEKVYSGNFPVKNIESVQEVSGGYVLTGRSLEGNDSAIFLKINYNGDVVWESIKRVNNYTYASDIAEMNNGNLLAITYSVVGSSYRSYLLELNPNTGAVINSRDLLSEGFSFWMLDIEKVSDGFAIVGGNWVSYDKTNIAKLNTNGQLIWSKNFTNPELASTRGYSVAQDVDGGFVVGGFKIIASNLELALIKVSGVDGTFDWIETFGTPSLELGTSVEIASDGGYLLSRGTEGLSSSSDMRFLKIKEIQLPSYIEGKVFIDNNGDCAFNSGDYPVANKLIQANGINGTYQVLTDSEGFYKFIVEPGNYSVSIAPKIIDDGYESNLNCSANVLYNIQSIKGQTVSNNNFVINRGPFPPGFSCDLELVSSQGTSTCPTGGTYLTPCPGKEYEYCVSYTNVSGLPISAGGVVINVALPLFVNGSISVLPTGDTNPVVSPHQVINPVSASDLTITSNTVLNPGQTFTYCIRLTIAPSNNGPYDLQIDALNTDLHPTQQCGPPYNAQPTQDACSCDPNDLNVFPKGCGEFGNISKDQELTYTIRFENIGPGSAHKVIITDALDGDLDLSSIKFANSSHNVTSFQINPNNELVILFENIELPAIQFAPNNKGFVTFKISPKPNLADGTVLSNQASIVFDSNEAVVTNEVINTVYTDPTVVSSFDENKKCQSLGFDYDFTYTGGSENVSFVWNFGPNATPQTSTLKDPASILFNGQGGQEVTLTVNKNGCSETFTRIINVSDVASVGNNKVKICHNGQTIVVNKSALQAHLNHGDCVGECENGSNKNVEQTNIIDNDDDNSVAIYPNPFKNSITVSFADKFDTFEIMDTSGRVIKSKIIETENEYVFDLSDLSNGVYFIKLNSPNQTITKKIVKN